MCSAQLKVPMCAMIRNETIQEKIKEKKNERTSAYAASLQRLQQEKIYAEYQCTIAAQ